MSGDFSFWYESGPVKEALIERNIFDNCSYHNFTATQEPLAVFPEIDHLEEDYYYHGKLTIKNNHFRAADRPLISVKSAAEVCVTGNTYEQDDSYVFAVRPAAGYFFTDANSPSAAFLHCGKVVVEENKGFSNS